MEGYACKYSAVHISVDFNKSCLYCSVSFHIMETASTSIWVFISASACASLTEIILGAEIGAAIALKRKRYKQMEVYKYMY